jgi:hypothetical protein
MGKKSIILTLSLLVFAILFMYSCEWIWPEFEGSYNLGNGIYMM